MPVGRKARATPLKAGSDGAKPAQPARKKKARERVKYLYVIALDPRVLQRRAFREENPRYEPGQPCVYVGVSSLSPGRRFDQHKRGYKDGRYVREFGRYLMPSRFEHLNPVPAKDAERLERELAEDLRRRGYAVHQN